MVNTKMGAAFVAASVAFGAGTAQGETCATMCAIPAQRMSASQMKAVEGKAHISLLVASKGVVLPAQALMATQAAAPTPKNDGAGNSPTFARSPSRDAAAFDFLPPPSTPTRG